MTLSPQQLPVQLLTDEHSGLRREVDGRIQRILDVLARGGWPDADVEMLVAYLRYVVLDQAAHEEGLLYPLARHQATDQHLQRLSDDHVHLRDLTHELADVVAAGPGEPDQLATLLIELSTALQGHLRNEEEILAPSTPVGVEALRGPLHSTAWFLLTEGEVVDVDRLPVAYAGWATVERLMRLRAGEQVEVRSGHSLDTVHLLLRRRGETAEFGWSYLEEGPAAWRARITRRA